MNKEISTPEKKVVDYKKQGKTNKAKGYAGERYYVNVFKDETSFDKASTTRSSSRLLDSCGVDINFIPLLVQVKVGEHKGLKPESQLRYIADQITAKLPEDYPHHYYPKICIHRKQPGKKRTEFDEIVTITFSDFMKIFKLAYPKQQ